MCPEYSKLARLVPSEIIFCVQNLEPRRVLDQHSLAGVDVDSIRIRLHLVWWRGDRPKVCHMDVIAPRKVHVPLRRVPGSQTADGDAWVRGCVRRIRFPNVPVGQLTTCRAHTLQPCCSICLHVAHFAALRPFWSDWYVRKLISAHETSSLGRRQRHC